MTSFRFFRAFCAASLLLGCNLRPGEVTRLVNGQPVEGRFISSSAYAWYARGAYLEARREWGEAQQAYVSALSLDTDSVEIWTRIGSVGCALAARELPPAFTKALEIDPQYEPLWYELARCELRRQNLPAALRSAKTAIFLDPNRRASSVLLAEIYQGLGQTREAERWRAGHAARWPARPATAAAEQGEIRTLEALLARQDLVRARTLAASLRISGGELAVRAAALGLKASALAQATWVLAAEPDNGDALVALLAVADEPALSPALSRLSQKSASPLPVHALNPLAARLMAHVLRTRIADDAARAWLKACGPLPPPKDSLERRLAAHLTDLGG